MILFNDFNAHYQTIADELESAVTRVLRSGWYILGEELRTFESAFAEWLGVKYVVGVGSGTDALALALMASDIGTGDDVITSALTAYPTITAIKQVGARPIVVDIDAETGLIDPNKIDDAVTAKTKAIIPVHLYGQSCDLAALETIAARHNLIIIEDCAQSVGATFGARKTGRFGRFGCFSFYPSKNLGAIGDGGAVVAQTQADFESLQRLRNYGQSVRYHHDSPGINSRLDEIQAAVLATKLPFLDTWTERRRTIAARYRAALHGVKWLESREYGQPVHHLFPIHVLKREQFMAHMTTHGIQTLIHYPVPVHKQHDYHADEDETLPVAESFADTVVSLPIYPELSDDAVDLICSVVNSYQPA